MSDLRPTAATRQRTLNFRLRLILKYGLLRGPAPRMASLTSKPPSKPVQALKECLVRKRSVIICGVCKNVKECIEKFGFVYIIHGQKKSKNPRFIDISNREPNA